MIIKIGTCLAPVEGPDGPRPCGDVATHVQIEALGPFTGVGWICSAHRAVVDLPDVEQAGTALAVVPMVDNQA